MKRASQSLPRLGVGYHHVGMEDHFADGSNVVGRARDMKTSASLGVLGGYERNLQEYQAKLARRKPLKPLRGPALAMIHAKLVAASYTMVGQDWANLFKNMDKDSSDVIEPHELMFAVRSVLKLAPSMISDTEVNKLFVTLDENGSGDVDLPEFFQFLEHGPAIFRERKRIYRELGVDGPVREAPVDHRAGKMPVRDAKTRVVDYNPGDEQVVHREKHLPLVRARHRQDHIDNRRADKKLDEKRSMALARQASEGLKANMGVLVEPTTINNELRLALRWAGVPWAERQSAPDSAKVENALAVLRAIQKYDLRAVAKLFERKLPHRQTWGEYAPRADATVRFPATLAPRPTQRPAPAATKRATRAAEPPARPTGLEQASFALSNATSGGDEETIPPPDVGDMLSMQ